MAEHADYKIRYYRNMENLSHGNLLSEEKRRSIHKDTDDLRRKMHCLEYKYKELFMMVPKY